MESLLRWGITNSDPNGPPPQPRKDLDPAIIDMILGKSDAELMKENMAIAMDVSKSEDERIDALDNLEMLIEQIDNANNLEKLKMWPSLHSLLTSEDATDPIIMQALWVIGTALQNNPEAQESYLALNPLSTLISFLIPSATTAQIRSKALYTLSGLLKHNAPAVKALDDPETDGWSKLRDALQDPEISVRRKAAFLLNTLLTPTDGPSTSESGSSVHGGQQQPVHMNSHAANLLDPSRTKTSTFAIKAIADHNILPVVVDGLTQPLPYGEDGDVEEPDADLEEKLFSILNTYAVSCGLPLDDSHKKSLKLWIEKEKSGASDHRWGLSDTEFKSLEQKLQ
ncbi:Fes1-domain-containing protein [Hymenopellis radicata]|nr:Fes1-domain-containing protein [Hymenopellis radicata]